MEFLEPFTAAANMHSMSTPDVTENSSCPPPVPRTGLPVRFPMDSIRPCYPALIVHSDGRMGVRQGIDQWRIPARDYLVDTEAVRFDPRGDRVAPAWTYTSMVSGDVVSALATSAPNLKICPDALARADIAREKIAFLIAHILAAEEASGVNKQRTYLILPAVFVPAMLAVVAVVAAVQVSGWALVALPFIWLSSVSAQPNLNTINGRPAFLAMLAGFALCAWFKPAGIAISVGALSSYYLSAVEKRIRMRPVADT